MAAETIQHVDAATLLQSHIIKELELILILGESTTKHVSVDQLAEESQKYYK